MEDRPLTRSDQTRGSAVMVCPPPGRSAAGRMHLDPAAELNPDYALRSESTSSDFFWFE